MEMTTCGLCQLQVPALSTTSAEIPIYQPQNDSLKLATRKLCKPCQIVLSQIDQFASHYQIKYCDSHFKSTAIEGPKIVIPQPKQSIQLLYASSSISTTTQRTRASTDSKALLTIKHFGQHSNSLGENEPEDIIHPYIMLVVEQIKSKNLISLSHLPKTLQLLIYLSMQQSSKETMISPQQRREKVKNVILFLSQRIHLNIEELPYVLVLVNFLLCFMDPNKVTAVIMQLSDIIITYSHLLTWKTLILEQDMTEFKSPLSPASLDLRTVQLRVEKLWQRIESILELARKGQAVLHEGIIRLNKLNLVEFKQYRKRMGEVLKPLLAKKQEKYEMSEERLEFLYLMKLQRNSFSLVLKNLFQSQQEIKQEFVQLNSRHKKEKEEYVQKIVKLSNKIEQLQAKIAQLQERNQHNIKTILPIINSTQSSPKSNTETLQLPTQHIQSNIQCAQEVILQSILTVTNLIAFNQQYISFQSVKNINLQESDSLIKIGVQEIEKLQQAYQKASARAKLAQQQKNRLLGIVSRKDDRFISVITQKDIIIQRYQQALWRMENGLEVESQPLAHRIRYIMHIFAKKQKISEDDDSTKKGKGEKNCDIY